MRTLRPIGYTFEPSTSSFLPQFVDDGGQVWTWEDPCEPVGTLCPCAPWYWSDLTQALGDECQALLRRAYDALDAIQCEHDSTLLELLDGAEGYRDDDDAEALAELMDEIGRAI